MLLKRRYLVLLAAAYLLPVVFIGRSANSAGPIAGLSESQDLAVAGGRVMFVENVGQFDPRVRFQARLGREVLWLADDGLWLTLLPEPDDSQGLGVHVALTFPDTAEELRLEPFGQQATVVTYGGPDGAFPAVPAWSGVRYRNLVPGVDLELSAGSGRWRWGLVGRTGTPQPVAIEVGGAHQLALADQTTTVTTTLGEYKLPPLTAGHFVRVAGSTLLLEPGFPNASATQVEVAAETPILEAGGSGLLYSTFLGGEAWEEGRAVTVDGSGRAYVTGYTLSLVFPTRPGVFTPEHGIDVYLFRLDDSGTDLDYLIWLYTATLNAEDYGNAIMVDGSGQAYVAGYTFSNDYCSYLGDVPGYDKSYNGNGDAYVMKVLPDGSGLVFCTYLGGNDLDIASSMALDTTGQIYLTGSTWSADYPVTAGTYDPSHNGLRDVYLLKLHASGTSVLFSTFLGGQGQDEATGVAVDQAGQAFLTGWTTSSNFPTTPGAFDPDHNGGTWDAFVTKVAANGGSLHYSTYFGGGSEDRAEAIGLDASGRVTIAGSTASDDLPVTPGALDPDFGGDVCGGLPCDAFVASLNAAGTELGYATYLGGSEEDLARDLFVLPDGRAYVAGRTQSPVFPVTAGSLDPTHNGGIDGFICLLASDGHDLEYGTYLGGTLEDEAKGLWVDGGGALFATGRTQSPDFPVTAGTYDPGHNGDNDIFVSRLDPGLPEPMLTFLPLVLGD
jgi:hypothetical protein